VRGRQEWGVRITADRETMLRKLAPAATAASSGSDYLRRRRAEMQADNEVGAEAARIAREIYDQLSHYAERAVVLEPRQPAPETLATLAFLVPFVDQDAFLRFAKELDNSHDGTSLDVTGPWPPYSFISADVGGPRA
jgi:Gas vesicle synthesis protein GvpL/GvpF